MSTLSFPAQPAALHAHVFWQYHHRGGHLRYNVYLHPSLCFYRRYHVAGVLAYLWVMVYLLSLLALSCINNRCRHILLKRFTGLEEFTALLECNPVNRVNFC